MNYKYLEMSSYGLFSVIHYDPRMIISLKALMSTALTMVTDPKGFLST